MRVWASIQTPLGQDGDIFSYTVAFAIRILFLGLESLKLVSCEPDVGCRMSCIVCRSGSQTEGRSQTEGLLSFFPSGFDFYYM